MKADRDAAAKDVEDELVEEPYVDVAGVGRRKQVSKVDVGFFSHGEKLVTENEINRSSSRSNVGRA
jgi:hypothetical protein